MPTLSQSVRKWRKIYLSPFIVPRRGLNAKLNQNVDDEHHKKHKQEAQRATYRAPE